MASLPMTYDFSTFYFCHTSTPLYLVLPTHNSDPIPNPEVFCHIGFVAPCTHFWPWFRELWLVISIIKMTNLNVPHILQCCCMPRVMIGYLYMWKLFYFSHKWIHLWPAAKTGKWQPVSGEGDRWKPSLTLSESLGYYKHSPNTVRVTGLL